MNINFDIKSIKKSLLHILVKVRHYSVFIFTIVIIGLYGYLIFQIGNGSQAEPNESIVTEKLNNVKRIKVDQQAIDKIQRLEEQNVGVKSLFKSARDNPFQDE